MNERITDISMSALDCVMAISGGNPGAVRVCIAILQRGAEIDPDSALGAVGGLLALDTHHIYESRVWQLFKDVCRESLTDTLGILRAVQLGFLSEQTLNHAIDSDRAVVDVAAELARVRDALPRFGENPTEVRAAAE